jgi:glycerol-1-phosphate dehydrogenase [NAD(P)+]
MEFGGMKASFPATAPVAVFADTTTIAAAPLDMTRAGLGDLLAKASSRVDWLASHLLYGEHYCATVERRVTESLVRAATHVEDVLGGSPGAVGGLLRGLVESGVAMAMVGSSRPASGCEHHASHFWDLLAANGRRRHTSHGLQVGYATQFAMRLQQHAFGGAVHELSSPRPVASGSGDAGSWFAGHGEEVAAVMEEKRRFSNERASRWPTTMSEWEAAQSALREAMGVFPLVAEALSSAGIHPDPGYLGLDRPTLRTTFRVANRIRSRYTVLDFLEGQGRLVEAIDEVIGLGSAAS